MFEKWKKQWKCDHEFEEIGRRKFLSDTGDLIRYVVLFCPKCNKHKEVNEFNYELEQAKSRARKRHRR